MGSGTVYNLLARATFLLSGYVLQFSMAHLLASPAEYGRFGVLLSLVTLARVVLSTGVPQAISQFIATEPSSAYATYRRGALVQMAGASLVCVLFLALTPALTSVFGDPALQLPMLIASPLIVLMAFHQVNLGYLGGRLWFGRQALLTFAYSVSRCVAALALVVAGLGINGAVLGLLFATACVALLSWLAIPRTGPASPVTTGHFLSFSWPLMIFAFGVSALLNLDLLLLKSYFPDSDEVGFYGGAVNLGKAPYFLFYAFATTAQPSVARLHAGGDVDKARVALARQMRFLLLLGVPSAGLLAVSAPQALRTVYQAAYASAALPLAVLCASTCALSLMVVLASGLTACGKPRASMSLVLLCLPVQCLLGMWLIPARGMLGAAASNLAATLLGLGLALVLVRRTLGNVFEVRTLWVTGLSSLLAMATVYSIPTESLGGLMLELLLGFGVYGASLLLTRGVTLGELARVRQQVFRRA